jgi:hypothetical protein
MGPPPKKPGTAQRRNKKPSASIITADPTLKAPKLPRHPGADEGQGWHEATTEWWGDFWASPMASECVDSDKHGLFMLAMLVDDYWTAISWRQRKEIAAEIRLFGQRYGTSPLDRNRLQWQVAETEDKQERAAATKRRNAGPAPKRPEAAGDARGVLRSIK